MVSDDITRFMWPVAHAVGWNSSELKRVHRTGIAA
jgi:hypothetical protein